MTNPKNRAKAAKKAEELLWMLMDLVEQHGNNNAKQTPTHGDNGEMDNAVQDYSGDRHQQNKIVGAFNAALNALARSDTREAAPHAEALLLEMLQRGDVKPDLISFNTVLNAWSRFVPYDQDAPRKAEELLNFMKELHDKGSLKNCEPDAYSYTTLINAWAKSSGQDKTSHALRILRVMVDKYNAGNEKAKPDVPAYTAVLSAAARSPSALLEESGFQTKQEIEDPYSIAYQIYKELLTDAYQLGLKPDHFAFASMLQVIANHTDVMSTERQHMVQQVFEDACHAGYVDSFVIKALREACPSKDLLERLLGSPDKATFLYSIDELPKEWTRHVSSHPRFRLVDKRKSSEKGETAESTNL
jgi:hypothetical protein